LKAALCIIEGDQTLAKFGKLLQTPANLLKVKHASTPASE
jgi:hypothetical protein